jgi:hypothetical protein
MSGLDTGRRVGPEGVDVPTTPPLDGGDGLLVLDEDRLSRSWDGAGVVWCGVGVGTGTTTTGGTASSPSVPDE